MKSSVDRAPVREEEPASYQQVDSQDFINTLAPVQPKLLIQETNTEFQRSRT